MSDFDKKIEDLNNKNNSTLNELFGLFGKDKNEESDLIKQTGNSSFVLNGNKIGYTGNGSVFDWLDYDWANGKLNWLTKSKFECYYIEADFKKELITKFAGKWLDGEFQGGNYMPYRGVEFLGGLFQGAYRAGWDSWKASPANFIGGTWHDGKNGILGMANINQLTIDRSGQSTKRRINLLRIPVGNSIKIKTLDNVEYVITVGKRLDGVSSDFAYSVYDSLNNKKTDFSFTWVQIRNGGNEGLASNTVIDIDSTKTLPLFGINLGSGIDSIQIEPSTSFVEKEPLNLYFLDLPPVTSNTSVPSFFFSKYQIHVSTPVPLNEFLGKNTISFTSQVRNKYSRNV